MFTIIDGIIIALILLCVLIGVHRGFIGQIAKFLGGVVRIVVAALLTKPIVKLISKTNINEHMFDKYKIKALGISDKFSVNLVGMGEEELSGFVGDALADAKIPKIFRGLFKNIFSINPETIAQHESVTLADLMAVALTNIILMVVTFVVLFVIIWLVCFFAKRWSKSMAGSTTIIARTNRLFGGVLGFVEAAAIIFLFLSLVSVFESFGWFSAFTTFINKSFITGPIYRLVNKFIESSFDLSVFVESWLNS